MGLFGPSWSDFHALQNQVESSIEMTQSLSTKIDQVLVKLDAANTTLEQVKSQETTVTAGVSQVLSGQSAVAQQVNQALVALQQLPEIQAEVHSESLVSQQKLEQIVNSESGLTQSLSQVLVKQNIIAQQVSQAITSLQGLPVIQSGFEASQQSLTQIVQSEAALASNVDQILSRQELISQQLLHALDPLQNIAGAQAELEALNANFETLISVMVGLAKSVKKLTRPPDPGRLSLSIVEESMGSVLKYDVVLPQAVDTAEVTGGELTVTVAGSDPVVIATLAGQAAVEGLEGAQDSSVLLSFVFVDDAGNKSTTPSVLDTTLKDTIPPENPGALGITVTGEVTAP